MIKYQIKNAEFESAADAINHAFEICAKNNLSSIEIRKVKPAEDSGFMGAIKNDVIDTMLIKGPAAYQIDALNNNF